MTDFSDIGTVFSAVTGGGAPWGVATALIALVALIKVWPVLQLQAQNAKAALRSERKDALHNCEQRMDALQAGVDTMRAEVTNLTVKMSAFGSAYNILDLELSTIQPDNRMLAAARKIVAEVLTDADSVNG